jgi:hypothetical protein
VAFIFSKIDSSTDGKIAIEALILSKLNNILIFVDIKVDANIQKQILEDANKSIF